MFCLGIMCFGVYAATSVSYTLSGHITYDVNDVFVDIDTTLYASKKDLYTSQSNIAEDMHSISSALESGASVPTTNLVAFPYSDHQSSLNNVGEGETSYVAKALDLNYGSYVADTASYAYYVAITISNYAEETISSTLYLDSLYDLNTNVIISPERTMENIPAGTSDSPSKVCLVFGLTLDNPAQSIDVSFEGVKLSVNKGELQETPGLSFTAIDNGEAYSVSSGTADAERLVIPAYHDGKPVTTANIGVSYTGAYRQTKPWKEIYFPNTLTTISGSGITSSPNLRCVQLPQSLESIGDYFLDACGNIKTLYIPENVISYNPTSSAALSLSSHLYSLYVNENNTAFSSQDSIIYNEDKTELYLCVGKKVGAVELPSICQSIGTEAFLDCSELTAVAFGDNSQLENIKGYAFYNCTKLGSIILPDSVTSIGSYAFQGCAGLSEIIIPNSVTSIGVYAFSGCTNLSEVELGNGITEIGSGIFVGTDWLTQLPTKHPDGIVASTDGTVKYAIKASTDIASVDLSGVKLIFNSAYENCTNLTAITIPESVIYIGMGGFVGCTNAVVTFEDTVNAIWHVVPTYGSIDREIDVTQPFETWKNYLFDKTALYSWEKKISA